jgi:hypothetical protein
VTGIGGFAAESPEVSQLTFGSDEYRTSAMLSASGPTEYFSVVSMFSCRITLPSVALLPLRMS